MNSQPIGPRILSGAIGWFGFLAAVALLVALGTSIFGGVHDGIYHEIRPGDVPVKLGRAGEIYYVRPWVRVLYLGSLFTSGIAGALYLILGALRKRLFSSPSE